MVRHIEDIQSVEMKGQGIKGVTKRIAIGPKDGYEGYFRVFTVQPGGFSPYHSHPWFHANYILEGSGAIIIEGIEHPVKKGSIALYRRREEAPFRQSRRRSPRLHLSRAPRRG